MKVVTYLHGERTMLRSRTGNMYELDDPAITNMNLGGGIAPVALENNEYIPTREVKLPIYRTRTLKGATLALYNKLYKGNKMATARGLAAIARRTMETEIPHQTKREAQKPINSMAEAFKNV